MRCASRMKGRMKTLFTQRYRGSVKVRWFHICSPRSPLTWLPKTSTLPLLETKALICPHPFSRNLPSNSDVIPFPQNEYPSLVFQGMEYDHEGQKNYKRNLEKENPIICHSVEEGEENKKIKLFFSVPVHVRNWIKAKNPTKTWGKVKEGGRIKREGKLSYPRMRDPVEVQPGQP